MSQDTITEDVEVISGDLTTFAESRLVLEMQKAEISQQVATAKQFPRSIKRASSNILDLVTLDDKAAEECIYSLPRGGKPIVGPSIRLAEVVAGQWGNCRDAARVVDVNKKEGYLEAEGIFHDLETNRATLSRVRRRITTSRGQVFNDDMILVTGNAASQIARRNAILAGVPKAIWRKAYDAAEHVIKGDIQTLAERRAKALKAFAVFGVTPAQVFALLGVNGEEEISLDHIPTLLGTFQALKNNEATVEEVFNTRAIAAAATFNKVANPLADDQAPSAASSPSSDQANETASRPAGETSSKVRGHTSELAQAEEIVGADGTLEKSRDGEPGVKIDDPVAYARDRGRKAAEQRRSGKAVPPEYREPGREAEAVAWSEGFAAFKAEQKAESQDPAEAGANG